MTAEIAIMNKEAVALAADSAVTMVGPSGEKVFTSANKLFTLSKFHPVGIMIYGNALFMNMPWETLIKIYRDNLGSKSFATVKEYADDFLDFLCSDEIHSEEAQSIYVERTIYSYLNFLKGLIKKTVADELEKKEKMSEDEIKKILKDILQRQYKIWENAENSPNIDNTEEFHKDVLDKHKKYMDLAISNVLEKLPFSNTDRKKLRNILAFLFYKIPRDMRYSGASGIVIAGFGEKEIFPSIVSYELYGVWGRVLKYKVELETKIDFNTEAVIIPFAQKDMVYLFMEGVHKDYLLIEESYLRGFLERFLDSIVGSINEEIRVFSKMKRMKTKIIDSILEEFGKNLIEYRKRNFSDPIMNIVAILPKLELAMMAEALINLTSLKRKWSTERETVGGPIDVALISKGDGFVWIKRKHYFKPELNPHFFKKYFKEEKQ